MTALMIKAINVPRMARVTWYRHRASVLGIPGLFLLAAALLVIDSLLQRHWVSSHHLTYCLAYADNSTSSRCLTQNSPYHWGFSRGSSTTGGRKAPCWRYSCWPRRQACSPECRGWPASSTAAASGSPGPRVSVRVAGCSARSDHSPCSPGSTAAICGVAAHWWFQVAQFRLDGGTTPWGWESFEMTPLSMVSWTLLAMALALLLGVTIRRVLPAMITFAVTFGGCLVLAQTWLSAFLFSVGTSRCGSTTSTQEYPSGSYVAQTWFARPGGPKLNPMTVYAQLPNVPQPLAGSLAHAAPSHRMGRLPAAQPPGLARARPQRHPRRGRRPRRPRLGLVAPQAPGRMKSGSADALRR